MEFFLQDPTFLALILAIIGLVGVLTGWSLRASLSERPIIEAYERLEQDRNSLARLYAQLKDQHEMRTNEVKRLTQEIGQLKLELSAHAIEKAVHASTAQAYAARLEKAEAQVAHFSDKIQYMDEQSAHLRTLNAQMQTDMERLREELRSWMTLHRDFAAMQKQVQELETANLDLEKERRVVQEQLDLARIEVENLQMEMLQISLSSTPGSNTGRVAALSDEQTKAASSTHPSELSRHNDDLKLITGLTPFDEQRLHEMGVFTFEQICNWNDQAIHAVAVALDRSEAQLRDENWVAQAKQLMKGSNKRRK